MWKNVLLTIVIFLWLIFIGYSASCLVAYLVGWPPYVAPLICAAISLLVIIPGLFLRKIKNVTAIFFVVFISLFLSSSANTVILGIKFEENTYRGAINSDDWHYGGYLYNIWGYKIINVHGQTSFDDDVIYLLTQNRVYALNSNNGEYIDEQEYDKEFLEFVRNPFTKKWHYRKNLRYGAYKDVHYLGEDDKGKKYYNCERTDGYSDIVKLESQCVYIECYKHNGIYAFQIQDRPGSDYEIIDVHSGTEIYSKYRMYEDGYKRFYYYDEYGDRKYKSYK